MFSFAFSSWPVLRDTVVIPCGVIVLGVLVGGMVAHRVRAAVKNGRFPKDSPMDILMGSMKRLPAVWGFLIGLNWAVHQVPLSDFSQFVMSCVIFAVLVWSVAAFFQRALCRVIEIRMGTGGNPVSTSLLLDLVGATVYIVGGIIVLDACGVSITPLVTALGVGGLTIALGLQETMANLFAGLHLLLTKQVRIGDHIRMENGAEGQITDITWRYAKIHTVTNNVIIVPNSKLAASVITNYDMPAEGVNSISVMDVAFTVTVGVAYDSDLDMVERVTLEVARDILTRFDPSLDIAEDSSTAPTVRFHTFGDSSIVFNVNLHTTSFRSQYLIRHEFIKALKRRYDEENIQIPFPIRTVRMEGSAE